VIDEKQGEARVITPVHELGKIVTEANTPVGTTTPAPEAAPVNVLYETAATASLADEMKKRLVSLQQKLARGTTGTTFLGGGCCVHLSIEYTSVSPSAAVGVIVMDAEGSSLVWAKESIQPGYYIKEGILSTNPGAMLAVMVESAVARVRWCEVFSC
jgi:hypothetical protein